LNTGLIVGLAAIVVIAVVLILVVFLVWFRKCTLGSRTLYDTQVTNAKGGDGTPPAQGREDEVTTLPAAEARFAKRIERSLPLVAM